MTPVSAHSPIRSGPRSIDLIVKFAELADEVPFTASLDDTTKYGADLYRLADVGEYGPVVQKS